jgi:hypothetical protein
MDAVEVTVAAIAGIAAFVAWFIALRAMRHWRRSLVSRVDRHMASRARRAPRPPKGRAEGLYFHVQPARPLGAVFSAIGIVGLCATWVCASERFTTIVLTVLFGSSAVMGIPALIGGSSYKSWFADGCVYWQYPSWFYGKDNSCRIRDVLEFRHVITDHGDSYHFLLTDQTERPIELYCFWDRAAFVRALQEENPSVVFVEKRQ